MPSSPLKLQCKHRPFDFCAGDGDFTLIPFNDLFGDVEAKAGAFVTFGGMEGFKEVFHLVLMDSGTSVLDCNLYNTVIARSSKGTTKQSLSLRLPRPSRHRTGGQVGARNDEFPVFFSH